MAKEFDWETCACFELGHQICSHYENWCSEREQDDWWNSLTQEERDSFSIMLCQECSHPFDDNDGKLLCKTCEDWLVVEDTYGINF